MTTIEVKQIKDTDRFRPAAKRFIETGRYCDYTPGSSGYMNYWKEEIRRCKYGYDAGNERITGYHYFYLNYSVIVRVFEKKIRLRNGTTRIISDRDTFLPNYWDYDKVFFDMVEECEQEGKHLVVLKARGKGYSYKVASMLCRNYFFYPKSKNYAFVDQNEFLIKDGIFTKAWDMMDFIEQHTAWGKKRQKYNTKVHRRASYVESVDGVETEKGYKSEIIGVPVKGDPDKVRGKRGKLLVFEEGGNFPHLLDCWQIARPSVEQGKKVFGIMIAFGCVCAGTKVWNNKGELINIEDLNKKDGILGFNGTSVSKEEIVNINPPAKKICYELKTNTGKILRCSEDHPILWSTQHYGSQPRTIIRGKRPFIKKTKFVEAKDIKIGDQVATIDEVPIFSNKEMWEPRLIGWLIGDGTYGKNHSPRMANCEDEINNYLMHNYDSKITLQHTTKLNKEYKEIRIAGICNKLREIGIYGQTKLNKTLPINIHSYSKHTITELLGGLFDTDGYVSIKNGIVRISIASMSEELLKEVQLLLQKCGIHGAIHRIKMSSKNPKDRNDHFRLEVSDKKSIIRFKNDIHLFVKTKQERINQIDDLYKFKKSRLSKNIDGLRFERIVSTRCIGLQDIYNLTTGVTHTYIANGIVTHNTGGSPGADYTGLSELFNHPEAYNAKAFTNIWNTAGANKPCGFFVPEYMNLEGFMDDDGNSNIREALDWSKEQRQKIIDNANDSQAIDRYICEHPFNPLEATLQLRGNIFPSNLLIIHLANIETTQRAYNKGQTGRLEFNHDGSLRWILDTSIKQITDYPLPRDADKRGAITIYEHPYYSNDGEIPHGLYIAGIDPYSQDDAPTSVSLGSILIYKRFVNITETSNWVVAEYTGRPDTDIEFCEICRRLLMYFNAQALYENMVKGLKTYFEQKHCEHLLFRQPEIIKDIIKNSKVERTYGIHMTEEIKAWCERIAARDMIEETAPGHKNLEKILPVALIKELISYNKEGNFDRVIAYFLIMLMKEQLYERQVKEEIYDNGRSYFPEQLFIKKRNFLRG